VINDCFRRRRLDVGRLLAAIDLAAKRGFSDRALALKRTLLDPYV
jgi:hypothetical protein